MESMDISPEVPPCHVSSQNVAAVGLFIYAPWSEGKAGAIKVDMCHGEGMIVLQQALQSYSYLQVTVISSRWLVEINSPVWPRRSGGQDVRHLPISSWLGLVDTGEMDQIVDILQIVHIAQCVWSEYGYIQNSGQIQYSWQSVNMKFVVCSTQSTHWVYSKDAVKTPKSPTKCKIIKY